MSTIHRLPNYPSAQIRKSLPPSQQASLTQTIAATLQQTLTLDPSKRDRASTRAFLSSYAKDHAVQALQALIWGAPTLSRAELTIRRRVLLLASSTPNLALDIQTLLDLAIVYAPTSTTHLRQVFSSIPTPELIHLTSTVETDLVPAFTRLLSPSQGLYAARKAAHCIAAFLHAAPPALARPFAHSTPFVFALAALYGPGLASIAHSYGGPPRLDAPAENTDEWENIWVATKASLIDAFHAVLRVLLHDLSSATGRALAAESERTFGLVFALLDAPDPSSTILAPSASSPPGTTPFLDRPLLTDYNATYPLARTLAAAVRHAAEKDARLDILEAALQPTSSNRDPGALTILLRSSGIPPGIHYSGFSRTTTTKSTVNPAPNNLKGKSRAPTPSPSPAPETRQEHDPDLDLKATQILDVLPDLSLPYIRSLLLYGSLGGDPERVLGALLEGSAPVEGAVELQHGGGGGRDGSADRGDTWDGGKEDGWDGGRAQEEEDEAAAAARRRFNAFSDAPMDPRHLHVGKRAGEGAEVLRDRAAVEAMKADILRRAEAAWEDEDADADAEEGVEEPSNRREGGKGKGKGRAFEDDDSDDGMGGSVKVVGDGEDSASSPSDDDEDEEEEEQSPETILELAYLRDPAVFNRDRTTRQSAARLELQERTGWGHEQIEGWRVMLERNPRKAKILEKHEFAGNRNLTPNLTPSGSGASTPIPSGQGDARGRGRGGGSGGDRGQGRGRGGGGDRARGGGARGGGRGGQGGRGGGRGGAQCEGSGGGGGGGARERAWKDRNKASRGNHDRKRGHDKKMARAGAGVPPA